MAWSSCARIPGWLCMVGVYLAVGSVRADTGVSDERVSLPDGPGSIGGVGENLTASGNMGAMGYAVPLDLPAGFAGATPQLSFQYNSMSGNEALGIGWMLPIPHIERFTRLGLPRYTEEDRFAADGSQELVRTERSVDGHTYRARIEGDFVRYTWHVQDGGKGGYWRAEYPDGSQGFFGADRDGVEVPSARASGSDGGVFRYMLVERVDRFGHRVQYRYARDGLHPLLASVHYLCPERSGAGCTPEQMRYHVEFHYEPRTDILSNGQPGFELQLTKRLAQVRISTRETALRRYVLEYEEATAGTSRLRAVHSYGLDDTPDPVAFTFEYSSSLDLGCRDCSRPRVLEMGTLRAAGGGGVDLLNGRATLLDINGDALPDILDTGLDGRHRFFLNTMAADGTQRFSAPQESAHTRGGSSFLLDKPGVQALDLDGDGFTDLVDVLSGRVLCSEGRGDWIPNGSCAGQGAASLGAFLQDDPGEVGESDPFGMRFMDYDGDRRIDLLHTLSSDSATVWHNLPGGFESDPQVKSLGRKFDTGPVQLADLNGDGLLDPIEVTETGRVWYRLNLGFGQWGQAVEFSLEGRLPGEHLERVELQDLNGDGLDDVVVVRGRSVRFALNVAQRFGRLQTLTSDDVEGTLPQADQNTSILFADMNGSGTTDVVWVDPTDASVTVLELFSLRPHLLTRIDNGIGGTQRVEYGTSARQQARDERAGEAWRYRLPQAISLVTATERFAQGAEHVRDRVERHYHHGFYDGVEKQYRGFELVKEDTPGDGVTQQAGHLEQRYDVQDVYLQGKVLREHVFGRADGQRYPIRERVHHYTTCPLHEVPVAGARPVRFMCSTYTETRVQEGAPAAQWRTLREQRAYDGYGNVTLSSKLGVVGTGAMRGGCAPCSAPAGAASGACGESCLGDEEYQYTEYISPGPDTAGRWLLGVPSRLRRYGEAGPGGQPQGIYAENLLYYDGAAFEGLALGQLRQGLPTRVCQRQSRQADDDCQGEGWVVTTRTRYDHHGNPLAELDPLGEPDDVSGHRSTLEYDPEYGLLPSAVNLFPSADGTPYRLRREVQYDPVFFQPTVVTRWMLQDAPLRSERGETRIAYDALGRRSKIARFGDTLDAPTEEFEYQLGAPLSRIVVRGRSQAGAAPDLEQVRCVDGLGRKLQTRTRAAGDRYQVTGFLEVNPQGLPVRSFQEYQGGAECDLEPPRDVPFRAYTHDAVGRVVRETEPDSELFGEPSVLRTHYGPLFTETWDAEDNDPESPHRGSPTRRYLDGLGRFVRLERSLVADGEMSGVQALWDRLGRFAGYLDATGHHRRQRHDLLGRVTEVEDPNAGTTRFTYDAAGNLRTRTDGRGVTLAYEYDGANRPIARFDAANPEASRVVTRYDFARDCPDCSHGEGRIVQTRYPLDEPGQEGQDALGYDLRGRETSLARTLHGHRFVLTTAHDNAGRAVGRGQPDGSFLHYRFDAAARLVGIDGLVGAVGYDARGQLAHMRYANGVVLSQSYDSRQRLRSLHTRNAEGVTLQGFRYARDRVGNLLAIEDLAKRRSGYGDRSMRFDHDGFYRLTRTDFAAEGEALDVAFDLNDNILEKVSSRGAASLGHAGQYRYDPSRPNALRSSDLSEFEIDAVGRTTYRQGTELHWDAHGRLRAAHAPDGRSSDYAYAADDRRVLERHDGSVSYFVRDFEVHDGIAVTYARVGGRRVARLSSTALGTVLLPDRSGDGRVDVGDAWLSSAQGEARQPTLRGSARRVLLEAGPSQVFLHHDHLGSLTLATDATGAVVGERAYYPFGSPRMTRGFVDRYGFTGQRRDPTTGLLHMRFRELDTNAGRWISPDPLFAVMDASKLQALGESTTGYAYVAGRPTDEVDPTGLVSGRRVALAVGGLSAVARGAHGTRSPGLAFVGQPRMALKSPDAGGVAKGIKAKIAGEVSGRGFKLSEVPDGHAVISHVDAVHVTVGIKHKGQFLETDLTPGRPDDGGTTAMTNPRTTIATTDAAPPGRKIKKAILVPLADPAAGVAFMKQSVREGHRGEYHIMKNNCVDYAAETLGAAGVEMPKRTVARVIKVFALLGGVGDQS